MLPPQPQVSLPIPKKCTSQGCSRPFLRRSLASVDTVFDVMYSIQSAISCGLPEPTLPLMYTLVPIISANAMNSCVPNSLVSATPPQCVFTFTGRFGTITDAIAPVVLVGEATAWPAHHRHLEVLQCRDDVIAISVGVRNGRLFAHPHAFVDAGAEMLGELAVDVRIDHRPRLIGAYRDRHVDRGLRHRGPRDGSAGDTASPHLTTFVLLRFINYSSSSWARGQPSGVQ